MDRSKKKVAALEGSKKWGTYELKFDELDNLASNASKFLDSALPSSEDIEKNVEDMEIPKSNDSPSSQAHSKATSTPDKELYANVEAANVPLHILDGYIAKFIHFLRVSYEDSSIWIWQYLQTLLYVSRRSCVYSP